MRREHAIFQGPKKVTLDEIDIPTPKSYREFPGGEVLPEKMPGWLVHTGKQPAEVDYGMIASSIGFLDSPDVEFICSGMNTKGPSSVAIGRHGNLFLWGFAGTPSQMTESGRQVFSNAVHWMSQFDGAPRLVDKQLAKFQPRDYASLIFRVIFNDAENPAVLPSIRMIFTDELWQAGGGTVRGVQKLVDANVEYLFLVPDAKSKSGRFVIDADLQQLAVSNRDPQLLAQLAKRLTADPKDAVARRVLARYAPEQGQYSGPELATWLEKHRDRLFFSDIGGYRWRVRP